MAIYQGSAYGLPFASNVLGLLHRPGTLSGDQPSWDEIFRRRDSLIFPGGDADAMVAPIGIPESFEEHMRMMFDLLVVAYQADLTRVFTFMTGREASQRTYPGLAMKETHHDTSHHGGQPEKKAQHAKINTLFISLFAEFVEKLKTSPEGDGSLLDHSLIAYGHGMSDGQAHDSYPLAFATVGSAGGRIRGNRYLKAPDWSPIANLWLGVAGLYDSPIEQIGESNARFELV
jgi:hypothetical protein